MILSFKRHFTTKTPTNFIEKIWKGLNSLLDHDIDLKTKYVYAFREKFKYSWDGHWGDTKTSLSEWMSMHPNIHTIRAGARWKPGHKIHFCVNPCTPDYFQFAPVIPVKATQAIVIKWTSDGEPCLYIDGQLRAVGYDAPLWSRLAQNDGFPDTAAFFRWFHNDFSGQIIHWTDLIY